MLLGRLTPQEYLERTRRSSITYENNVHFALGLKHELDGKPEEARAAYQAAVDATLGRNHPWKLAQ